MGKFLNRPLALSEARLSKVALDKNTDWMGSIYSPSPEYHVACYRDEWRGEPRRSSSTLSSLPKGSLERAQRRRSRSAGACAACAPREGGLASAQFRFDTPQLAAGSFIVSPTLS